MTGIKAQVTTFAVGSGLIASGLAIPADGLPLVIAGGTVAAAGYALTVMDWKGINPPKIPFTKLKKFKSASSASTQSAGTGGPSPNVPSTTQVSAAAPSVPQAPATTGSFPSAPEMPSTPQKPSTKTPTVHLPKTVLEHKIPLSLIGVGLALVVSAIYFLLPSSPQYAVFTGLFIPGLLLLVLGVRALWPAPEPEVKRFCIYCSFPMQPEDVRCGRCKRPRILGGPSTKTCVKCSEQIPDIAKYCNYCGAEQPNIPLIAQ